MSFQKKRVVLDQTSPDRDIRSRREKAGEALDWTMDMLGLDFGKNVLGKEKL